MIDNKLKYAQDVMNEYAGGEAMGGFNSRILGDPSPGLCNYTFYSGWELADGMIKKGKIFYTHIFRHLSGNKICNGLSFSFGGSQVCNTCGRNKLLKDWWKVKVMKDGDAWCCIGEGFENLMESDNYAFGDTRAEALNNYEALYLTPMTNHTDKTKEGEL